MSYSTWETILIRFCTKASAEVSLEAELVYPAEWLPDMKPRILAHRCSHGMQCNLDERAGCIWSGTKPFVDPFTQA